MSMRTLRVALCQIESHPAVYGGHVAYPEEPFVPPPNGSSLSRLIAKGIGVQELQEHCGMEYAAWLQGRLDSIIGFLQRIDPHPDIVLFPEGAVLLQSVPQLHAWSAAHAVTVLAGTHTPLSTPAGRRSYNDLGISATERKKAMQALAGSVLPLIRNGKVLLIPKKLASPFERTDVSTHSTEAQRHSAYPIRIQSGKLRLLPLVCSEALQLFSVKGSYDVIGVVSYDPRPEQFQPFIEQQVKNKKLVLFCNDGRYGKTRLGTINDRRTPSWLHDTFPNGLPPGEAILVVDVDLDATALEMGTATPRAACQLTLLASIVGEHASSAEISRALPEVLKLPEGAARAAQLSRLLEEDSTNDLQRARLNHLYTIERRGQPSADWWKALGKDCVVDGQDDIRDLEARLSGSCKDSLTNLLSTQAAQREDVAHLFLQFYAECSTRAQESRESAAIARIPDAPSVVDRETEVGAVTEFLDSGTTTVLEVTGLPQIGKSSVLDKALGQSGITSVCRVSLTSTSSADYIVYTLLKRGYGLPLPPYSEPIAVVSSASMLGAIRRQRVIIFERAHLLTDFGTWRDEHIGSVIAAIVDVAQEANVKLIFETQRELPIELSNPSVRQRLRVGGLQKDLCRFGVALFDAQLRRVGLSTEILSGDNKSSIVERLGGHPVAIALAADASYDEGGEAVFRALRERKGFYLTFLERLLRPLNLTDEAQTILRLLTLARVPVDRTVALSTEAFPAASVLRNLIALGTVNTANDGRIEVAGVLREYFDPKELAPELTEAFHRAAARAFEAEAKKNPSNLEAAVEAEYHGGVVGLDIALSQGLLDGALATAQHHFDSQRYNEAGSIIEVLLRKRRSREVLRLGALVASRLNQSIKALELAREVLRRNPQDTRLLGDLVKISLSQYQGDTTAKQFIDLARSIGVEDVSVLVAEGRIYLRQNQLNDAAEVFRRAQQLSRRNPWPYYYLGTTYQRMGRLEAAIDVLLEGEEFYYRAEVRSRNALNAIRTQLGLAYLFSDDVDAAALILDPLFEEDTSSPEVMRAYAALTIKRDGIQMAEKAFDRLKEARVRNRFDRCQFHLFYGLFQLGINNPYDASKEFASAHAADRSNVYVMMKWARTLYEIARDRYLDRDTMHEGYVSDCAQLVEKILEFDPDNDEGINLMNSLHQTFGVDVGDNTTDEDA